MRFRWSQALFVMLLLGATSVSAQSSLAGSGRTISADKPESTGVVIDNSSLVRTGSSSRTGAGDPTGLFGATQECADAMREVNSALAETGTGKVFYDPDWRRRMEDAGLRFQLARGDFDMVEVGDRYRAAYEKAVLVMDASMAALGVIQDAIANDHPVFARAKREMLQMEKEFDAAFAEMRADSRAESADSTPAPIDPIAASLSIGTLCRNRYGSPSDRYDACVGKQQAAIDQMTARSGPGVGLMASKFNNIRNNCRFEWPNDFVNRDECEQRRIAAAR